MLLFVSDLASLACCALHRSFTVLVLMRDESGSVMPLLLLPFHQQRTSTFTQREKAEVTRRDSPMTPTTPTF